MKKILLILLLTLLSSCQVRSPLTGLNYDIDYYRFGITVDSDLIGLRFGTRPEKLKPIIKDDDHVKKK